jgi:hypothetical protein
VDSTPIKTATISCPVDKRAIGGGALIVAGTSTPAQLQDVALGGTYPTALVDGWNAVAWETDSVTTTWSVTVYVLCATVT